MKTKTKSDVRRPARKTRPFVRHVKSELEAEDFVPAPVAAEPVETAPTESAHGDHLHLYYREIAQIKLLTPEEELSLAKRVKRGDEAARERMIIANLRLVVKIARNYEGLGLPLLDLINEGNIGLIKGVERFDPNKGAKLSSYASWWIKQAITRALANQSKTIRLPVHVVGKVANIRRAEVKLREAFDREPTDQEVAEHLGYDVRRVQKYRDVAKASVSLDAPIDADGEKMVSEVVADLNAAAPFDGLVRSNDNGMVKEALATLTERERQILVMRFGLEDGTPKTLEEIAAKFDVTRERIRQIQEEALKKMRGNIGERDALFMDAIAMAA
jgi:RNA polymerase primary sigma factor